MTFSSAFIQVPTARVIAWTLSFLQTTHLQNLVIQSFYSLTTASSPWWFGFYHHNCFFLLKNLYYIFPLTFSSLISPHLQLFLELVRTPVCIPFLSALSCLHFPHYSTLTPESIFLIRIFPILSTSSPPCSLLLYIHGENNSALCCVDARMPREFWEKWYTLTDHFNSWLPASTGLNIAWKSTMLL